MITQGQAMQLRYATLCSGIEAPSIAWERLGWEPQFFSEIADFPSAVLASRWPQVPNLGDLLAIDGAKWRGKVDVLWASFPCQAYSLAGRRQGVEDPRGALTLKGVQLVDAIDPYFFCFENVKGILSDRDNAFGHFLSALVGEDGALEPPGGRWTHAGHVHGPRRSVAWRVMDAQFGGVPQRRERVFLVGCPSHGASPQRLLFEFEGVRRDHPPRRQAVQADAALVPQGAGGRVCGILGDVSHTLTAEGADASEDGTGRGTPIITFDINDGRRGARRLTPVECERLMGFPDDHTRIAWAGRPAERCPDGPRYKVIGNSVSVPDVAWIGERIQNRVREALQRREVKLAA